MYDADVDVGATAPGRIVKTCGQRPPKCGTALEVFVYLLDIRSVFVLGGDVW